MSFSCFPQNGFPHMEMQPSLKRSRDTFFPSSDSHLAGTPGARSTLSPEKKTLLEAGVQLPKLESSQGW